MNHLTVKPRKRRLNMNVVLIIKYSSTVMQGKKKLCEFHIKFLSLISKTGVSLVDISVLFKVVLRKKICFGQN